MGRDAVIVQTRRLRQGGFLGMLATEIVEVTAAIDPAAVRTPKSVTPVREKDAREEPTDDAKILAVHLELASMRKTLETAMASMKNASGRLPSSSSSRQATHCCRNGPARPT